MHYIETAHIRYERQVLGWDQLETTRLEVLPGSLPRIAATLYYRYVHDGIELLMAIENRGDRIARNVVLKTSVERANSSDSYSLEFEGLVYGGHSEVVEVKLPVGEPAEITIPNDIVITCSDREYQAFAYKLEPKIRRLEYQFPSRPSLVGRTAELVTLDEMIEGVRRLSAAPSNANQEVLKLLLIEGNEGVGKTRIHRRVGEASRASGIRCVQRRCKGTQSGEVDSAAHIGAETRCR